MPSIIIVYHSGYGHTKVQAEHVLAGAQSVPGVSVKLITSDEGLKDLTQFAAVDAIIFGCPTYMGGPSAQFKSFIDAAGQIWMKQGWKDKLAAGFTNSGSLSGDKLATLQQLFTNAMQHSMIWVGLGVPSAGQSPEDINRIGSYSGAMAQSSHGSKSPQPGDLKTAELLGKRVAEATLRWTRGNT